MPNILEQFFDEASSRFINESEGLKNIPILDYPEHKGFDPTQFEGSNDLILPAKDYWAKEGVFRKIAGDDYRYPLDKDARSLLDGALREVGFDAYAFYKSRRYKNALPFPDKWGIFYLEHGIARVRELIEATYPGYGGSQKLAYEFLREHERFHLKFDLYALSVEATLGRALYEPLNRSFRHHKIYQVEEALANRDAWDWSRQERIGLKEFAYDFMKLQPGAYARFDEKRSDLASELAANLLDLNLSLTARRADQALWVGNVPDELLRRSLCPEYFVGLVNLTSWLNPAWKLPEVRDIKETQTFSNLLTSKYSTLNDRWQETKKKLIQNAALPGLDFKRWEKSTGYWSVRINSNFRAHLRPLSDSNGAWEAQEFGTHKSMGHG